MRCRTAFFGISEQQLLQFIFAAPSYSISGASSRENRKNAIRARKNGWLRSNGHTAVKLTLQELEAAAGAEGWVDVCKEPEDE